MLLNSLSSALAFCFLGCFIERGTAMLTKQCCQRRWRRHSLPSKYAFLAAGEALAYQKHETLIALRIFAANCVRASAVETLEVVGVLMPAKWAAQR